MKPATALRYWHGMTEAEAKRYLAMHRAGQQLNAIETAEAEAIIERVKAWEANPTTPEWVEKESEDVQRV